MKNFPHQINDLTKLHKALNVFVKLSSNGEDISGDGVVGREMASEGVYTFRDKALTVEEALELEDAKPKGRQGTRTFAREMRRFFVLLGFLTFDAEGSLEVSAFGRYIASLDAGSSEAKKAWKEALRNMALVDGTGESHPYQIMLRLAAARPDVEKLKLALALEARDDSDEEFNRLITLIDSADWRNQLAAEGVTEHMLQNSVKILPSIAVQLGDLVEGAEVGTNRVGRTAVDADERRRANRRIHRTVTVDTIAVEPQLDGRAPDEEEYADPEQTNEKRLDRLRRHNDIVRKLATRLSALGYRLLADPYDVLAVHDNDLATVLAEIKTLSGKADDETARVRNALAQLEYYEWFDVPADYKTDGIVAVACFELKPSQHHIAFLEARKIVVIWSTLTGFGASEWSLEFLSSIGFELEN